MITVPAVGINELLSEVLAEEGLINVLKIDVEGAESRMLQAIDSSLLSRISCIHAEIGRRHTAPVLDGFRRQDFGTIHTYTQV